MCIRDREVNRWGSKYEMLLLPLITLLMGVFLLKVSRWSGKQTGAVSYTHLNIPETGCQL